MKYFEEVDELKKLVNTARTDIRELCGDVKITFALRKAPAIGNTVVRNRRLSDCPSPQLSVNGDQRCNAKGCRTDPLLFDSNDIITVNGMIVILDPKLTCKDKNIIYIAQCVICSKLNGTLKDDTYFGQTINALHIRMNGHRNKFCIDSNLLFEKSALSMHCFLAHKSQFSLEFFKIGIVKKVRPADLNREEEFFINKFRTNVWGLNRIKVVR